VGHWAQYKQAYICWQKLSAQYKRAYIFWQNLSGDSVSNGFLFGSYSEKNGDGRAEHLYQPRLPKFLCSY
jgi:hypothetical protein